jgi:crotonobetainyl-CoA:carnitine CoA-transferase CaiB-like acyl-CoA transferase
MDELEDADACVAPVQTFEEAVSDPQFQARGMVVEPEGSVTGRQVGCPIKLASGPVEVRRAPLTVGADDAAVLASLADGR